jgi:hypothetical protein
MNTGAVHSDCSFLFFGGIIVAGGKPMDNSLSLEPTAEEAAQFQDFLRQGLAEMDRLFELMAQDQEEIDRLAASTHVTLSEIRVISERTNAILATLRAA